MRPVGYDAGLLQDGDPVDVAREAVYTRARRSRAERTRNI